MNFKHPAHWLVRTSLQSLCLIATGLVALPALADTISGQGQAQITKDVETVRSTAQAEARRQLIVAMLTKTIGRDRLGEVSQQAIAEMARQIRPDMITGQTSERRGNVFVTTIVAEIDEAWFRNMLSDYGIDSSSRRADGNRALVLVYLDREDGTASDLSQPAVVDTTYDRRTGASFSDHSVVSASAREAAAARSKNASASSFSAAGAMRGSSRRESAAEAYRGRAASASASNSASAYAASASFADRTKVDAAMHDDTSFRQHVVYQQPPRNADGDAIRDGLSGDLLDYDVQIADSWMALSAYFPRGVPRYDDLKHDPRFGGFLQNLKSRNTPFFMGGTYKVTQSGIDPASNQSACSGELNASAASSEDGRVIAGGQFPATALGSSPEACSASLTKKLARAAAAELGPQIERFWRSQARDNVGQNSRELASYSLVLRGARLDMSTEADLMDALGEVEGLRDPSFVSQSPTEMRVNVVYSGTQPLQFAIYQKLRAKPGFAAMQAKVDGRSILLCMAACP